MNGRNVNLGHDESRLRRTECAEICGSCRARQPESRERRFDSAMYRPVSSPRERAATVSAVVLVHVGLALALLNLSGDRKAHV